MFRYKKITIYLITFIFILISLVELIKYLVVDNTLFGVYYSIINLVIVFLLVPCAYNYKKYYSKARISKLIMVILLILFNSFILENILFKSMGYMDSSKEYIKSIFVYKNILKTILSFILAIFLAFEFKLDEVIKKSIGNKKS